MDKALEVIMVAMVLVVAAVVILSMLQGRTADFSDYTQDQTNSSDCGIKELEYERLINKQSCSETTAASNVRSSNQQCDWAGSSSQASDYC